MWKYIQLDMLTGCDRFSPFQVSTLSDPLVSPTRSQCASCCIIVQLFVQSRKSPWVQWILKLKIHLKSSSWAPSESLNMLSGEPSVCSTTLYGISSKAISTKLAVDQLSQPFIFLTLKTWKDFSKKPRSFVFLQRTFKFVKCLRVPEFGLLLATICA